MAHIPFLDLRASYLTLQSDIDAAVSRVLASGRYIQGPEVTDFETALPAIVVRLTALEWPAVWMLSFLPCGRSTSK